MNYKISRVKGIGRAATRSFFFSQIQRVENKNQSSEPNNITGHFSSRTVPFPYCLSNTHFSKPFLFEIQPSSQLCDKQGLKRQ